MSQLGSYPVVSSEYSAVPDLYSEKSPHSKATGAGRAAGSSVVVVTGDGAAVLVGAALTLALEAVVVARSSGGGGVCATATAEGKAGDRANRCYEQSCLHRSLFSVRDHSDVERY